MSETPVHADQRGNGAPAASAGAPTMDFAVGATACARQAEALRAAAQTDADAARQRLEDADQRARQLEDAARDRWDAVRAQTEARFAELQTAEHRFAERTRQVEAAVHQLRSQVSLLDQVHHVEQVLAGLRASAHAVGVQPAGTGASTAVE
jgi:DNA anti-recombination protein RmuC